MLPLHQSYLDNLAAVRALIKPHVSPELTDDEILALVHQNAERVFSLHNENNQILQEILFSKTADTLSREEALALDELAGALFNYNRSADVGIAYRIHQLLYDYAVLRGNVDLIIRELYYQGITLYYLNVRDKEAGVNLYVDKIGEYFRGGAAYLDQFESLKSSETRGYIIRCLGNLKYGMRSIQGTNNGARHSLIEGWKEYESVFEKAMSIVESPYYRSLDKNIPWDNFAYTLHYDRTTFLSGLRSGDYPEVAKAVLESATYIYRHQEQIAAAGEKNVGIRTQYVYAAARYHNGLIPAEELVKVLLGICENAPLNNFSGDNIWAILSCPEYLIHYKGALTEEEQEKLEPQLKKLGEKQMKFLFLMPPNEYAMYVSQSLQTTVEHAATRDPQFSEQVLDYILACHPPTFVHSEVVAMLTRRCCERIAETSPRLLDGVFGMKNPAADPAALQEFLDRAYHAGLYHDVGKCMLLSYIGQYSRRLLHEEFEGIQLHPRFGCMLLDSLDLKDYSHAAKYHHLAFDHHGGYPMDHSVCPPETALIVNVIAVVDSLDAGTDNVGRSYAASKTYEQLIGELRAGAGSRYAPEVTTLFDDPGFYAATEQFLRESRRRAYLDAYQLK